MTGLPRSLRAPEPEHGQRSFSVAETQHQYSVTVRGAVKRDVFCRLGAVGFVRSLTVCRRPVCFPRLLTAWPAVRRAETTVRQSTGIETVNKPEVRIHQQGYECNLHRF